MQSGLQQPLTHRWQLFLSAPFCLFTPDENDPPPSRQRKKEKKSSNGCFPSSLPQLVILCSISPLNHLVLLPERQKQKFSGSAKNPEQSVRGILWSPCLPLFIFPLFFERQLFNVIILVFVKKKNCSVLILHVLKVVQMEKPEIWVRSVYASKGCRSPWKRSPCFQSEYFGPLALVLRCPSLAALLRAALYTFTESRWPSTFTARQTCYLAEDNRPVSNEADISELLISMKSKGSAAKRKTCGVWTQGLFSASLWHLFYKWVPIFPVSVRGSISTYRNGNVASP